MSCRTFLFFINSLLVSNEDAVASCMHFLIVLHLENNRKIDFEVDVGPRCIIVLYSVP